MEKVYVEVIERKVNCDNMIFMKRIDKQELPVPTDIIEFYPDVVDRTVTHRKMYYEQGKLEKVKLYVK